MRVLTARQKKYLNKIYRNGLYSYEDLTTEEWETLEAMNDTEILWQEVNRWLWDKNTESDNAAGLM